MIRWGRGGAEALSLTAPKRYKGGGTIPLL